MNRLSDIWTREGPGIPKDAPKPTGLALFGSILRREAWDLFVLNLLIVAASLPLVTAPAAHAAATRIAARMVQDENVWLLRDLRQAFGQVFARATLAGAGTLAALGTGAYAVYVWAQMAAAAPLLAAPAAICLAVTLFLGVIATHLFVLIALSDLPLRRLLRPALAASFARPLPVLGALCFVAALWLAHVLFYPVSIFMPAVLNFSLGTLALTFAALPAALRALAQGKERALAHQGESALARETAGALAHRAPARAAGAPPDDNAPAQPRGQPEERECET